MNFFLKNSGFIVLSLVAAMLASCGKEETIPDQDGRHLISVSPLNSVMTKSAIDGTSFPTSGTFLLSAYYNAAEGTSGNYFQKITFKKSSSGSYWTADKYWPLTGTLDFFAASYDGLTPTSIKYGTNVSDGLTLVFPDNSSTQTDIMHASSVTQSYSASGTNLVFKHAEALLAFTASSTVAYDASTNVGLTITKVTVNDAYHSGTVAMSSDSDSTNGYCVWSDLGSQKDVDVPGISSYDVPGTAMDLTASGNHFGIGGYGLLVPEQAQTSFTVYFTLHNGKDADGNDLNNSLQYTCTCSGNWVEGKKYNYIINYTLHGITVNVSITDWTSEDTPFSLPN